MESYLEKLEEPDGQFIVLLNRLPYDIAHMIEAGFERERDPGRRADIVLRAALWECEVKHYLTGKDSVYIGDADPALVGKWRDRAVELYLAWKKEAMPGPKGSTRKPGSRTRTGKNPSSTEGPIPSPLAETSGLE